MATLTRTPTYTRPIKTASKVILESSQNITSSVITENMNHLKSNSPPVTSVVLGNPWFIAFVIVAFISVCIVTAFSITVAILGKIIKRKTSSKPMTSLSVQREQCNSIYIDYSTIKSAETPLNGRQVNSDEIKRQKIRETTTNSMYSNDNYMCTSTLPFESDCVFHVYAVPYLHNTTNSKDNGMIIDDSCMPNPAYNVGSLN